MAVYYPSFDCVLIDTVGTRTPSASEIIDVYNVTAASSLGTVTSDTNGIVAAGSFTATDGDIVEFSHASLPLTFRLKLAATAALAYTQNTITAYVMENLATLNATDTALLYAADLSNPNVEPVFIGSGKSGTTVEINYTTNVAKSLRIYPISQNDKEFAKTHFDTSGYDDISIPALAYQPLDSDLTTLAANITAFGHSLVDDANAAAAQSTLGLLGANDRVLYQAGGVVAQSANLTHNGTSLGVGGPTIGTINGNSFATVRGHFRSTGGGYLAMDTAGASGLLLNDSTQSANSRLWSILSNSAVLSFATMMDAGVATNRWTLNRSGQTVIGSGSVINAEILNVRGAGGTSYTNADFVVSNSTVAGKGIFMQFDNTNDVGRIQAANYGVAFKNLCLQVQGGNVSVGSVTATARLHLAAGTATASTAPLKLTSGTVNTTAEAGAVEYNNTFHVTNSDATRRHIATAPNTTKVTGGAPYTNDGYVVINIGGTDFKVMTTA